LKNALLRYRVDLRVHDHPVLNEVATELDGLLPVVSIDPEKYKPHWF
jgi:hypothetical protein